MLINLCSFKGEYAT